MKNIITLIILLFFTFCKNQESNVKITVNDTAKIAGVFLQIIDKDSIGELEIKADKNYIISGKIKISPPYHFLRRNSKILSFSYPEREVEQTIIFQGSDGVQGILIKKDSIIYEDFFPTTNFYNKDQGADEIVYQDFAYRFYKNKY